MCAQKSFSNIKYRVHHEWLFRVTGSYTSCKGDSIWSHVQDGDDANWLVPTIFL